ncbi:MAG: hypothetical protein K1X83_01635 [Oligoflexia bacterium]|nr:hypothetical protein [Oligoflexia bacterium]
MHRSGTSAVSGLLSALNVDFGASENLIAPSPDNLLGYFEYERLTNLNAELLALLGASWSAPPDLKEDWWDSSLNPGISELQKEGSAIITSELKRSGRWGWKDPRNCLLLPFWERVAGVTFDLVFIYREPIEVARSLEARDNLPIAMGLSLWEHYNRQALINMAGHRVCVLSFDTLFEQADALAATLAEFLSLDGTAIRTAAGTAEGAIAPQLRHHACTAATHSLSPAQAALQSELQRLPRISEKFRPPILPASDYLDELEAARRIAGASLSFMQKRLEALTLQTIKLQALCEDLRTRTSAAESEQEYYRRIITGPGFTVYNSLVNVFRRVPVLRRVMYALALFLLRRRI